MVRYRYPRDVPRPNHWETPNLKDESSFFKRKAYLAMSIPARLIKCLRSFPEPHGNQHTVRDVEKHLRTTVRFHEDKNWEPWQLLGTGTYGRAGRWVHQDENGVIIDEVVVKQMTLKNHAQRYDHIEPEFNNHRPIRGLLTEAVVQKQLNEYNCENLVHLRGYALVTDHWLPFDEKAAMNARNHPIPEEQQQIAAHSSAHADYRFYLEYAPYQTLLELINRHRAWNQPFPEPFLWHVFDSLAAALQIMSQGPKEKFSSWVRTRRSLERWPEDYVVLHADIKLNNIFLGYEQWKDNSVYSTSGGSAVLGYPVIKLGDFGLADITGPDDPDNIRTNYWKTTKGYKPPEHMCYGIDWRVPINPRFGVPAMDQNSEREARVLGHEHADGFLYGDKSNVWAVGKVIYDLITLSRTYDLNRLIAQHGSEFNYYNVNQRSFMTDAQWRNDTFRVPTDDNATPAYNYSNHLLDLVRQCLQPKLEDRIRVNPLRRQTQRGLAGAEHGVMNPPSPAANPAPVVPNLAPVPPPNPPPVAPSVPTMPQRRPRKPGYMRQIGTPASDVAYQVNQFNSLPLGTFRPYEKYWWEYKDLKAVKYTNKDWSELMPPPAKWAWDIARFNPAPKLNHPDTWTRDPITGRILFPSPQAQEGGGGGGGGAPPGGAGTGNAGAQANHGITAQNWHTLYPAATASIVNPDWVDHDDVGHPFLKPNPTRRTAPPRHLDSSAPLSSRRSYRSFSTGSSIRQPFSTDSTIDLYPTQIQPQAQPFSTDSTIDLYLTAIQPQTQAQVPPPPPPPPPLPQQQAHANAPPPRNPGHNVIISPSVQRAQQAARTRAAQGRNQLQMAAINHAAAQHADLRGAATRTADRQNETRRTAARNATSSLMPARRVTRSMARANAAANAGGSGTWTATANGTTVNGGQDIDEDEELPDYESESDTGW